MTPDQANRVLVSIRNVSRVLDNSYIQLAGLAVSSVVCNETLYNMACMLKKEKECIRLMSVLLDETTKRKELVR